MKFRHLSWLRTSFALWAGIALSIHGIAQSGSGPSSPTLSRTYDTVITGIGYGNYNLRFPQFDPHVGTLSAVRIKAVVTVQYGFTLKNVDAGPSTYSITAGREDYFSSAALAQPYDNIVEQSLGSWQLNPGGVRQVAPFPLFDQYNNTDSITDNIAPFLGTGQVSIAYSPITYTNIRSNNNFSYSYSAIVRDTTHFSVTYFYSGGGIPLALALTGFTAVWQGASTARLAWTAENEVPGVYEVQESKDGVVFDPSISVLAHTASGINGTPQDYQVSIHVPVSGSWYYRLKSVDRQGDITYSEIKRLNAGSDEGAGGSTTGRLALYPNPAVNYVNVALGGGASVSLPAVWQIDLLSMSGGFIQQEILTVGAGSLGGSTFHFDFRKKLPAGVYIIRATDLQTLHAVSARLLVRGG